MVKFIKVILNKAENKVWGMKIILINHIIWAIFIIIVDKEKEDFNGIMDKYTMVNGLMAKNKVVVSGKDLMVYHMSDNGIQM